MEFCIPVFLIFLVQLVTSEENNLDSNYTSTSVPTVSNPNIVTIDLRQCFCSVKDACDLTIIKSSLREANCNDGEHLCCPMIKSQVGSNLEAANETDTANDIKSQSQNNVRVYSIYPTSAISPNATSQLTQSKPKSKKNCSCKSRGTCPHKYIDYGFGFHCSYSTVRCCLPEEDPIAESDKTAEDSNNSTSATPLSTSEILESSEKNMTDISKPETLETPALQPEVIDSSNTELLEYESNTDAINNDNLSLNEFRIETENEKPEGELQITEVTNWSEEDSFDKDSECFCLSMERCMASTKYDLNSIERRRDTLCPGDLIQCCGKDVVEEITKKKDDNSDLEVTQIKQDFPPYQQPVQLPGDKLALIPIPTEEESNSSKEKEATLPPPQLPTQYHSYEPVSYNRGNVYTPNSYQTQLSGPLPYQKNTYGQNGPVNGQNIRPWVNLASPSSYSKYNPTVLRNQYQQNQGYPRGPYPDDGSSRSSKPGGLFDTLAQMLG